MTTVLAVDQGTSGTKAVVVDGEGTVHALAERALEPRYLPDGGVEQDPADLIDSVLDCATRAAEAAGVPVDAVALANQGETVLAWDPYTGRPLSPAVVWQDRRAEALCADRAADAGWVAQRTGLVLDPYFCAPKMAWLRERITGGVVTTTDTWIVHRLTGQFVTDASTASRSLLTGLDDVAWDADLLALFALQDESLPRIVGSDEVVGETGLLGGSVPVGGLVVDQQAALAAQACLQDGQAKCTFGTGAFLLANAGTVPASAGVTAVPDGAATTSVPDGAAAAAADGVARRSVAGLAACVAWLVRGRITYCFDGQVYTAASAVRWLADLGVIGSAADLDRLAAPGSGGALVVPALAGLAAPRWRSDARASLVGLSLSTGRGEVIRAFIEGLACQVAELVEVTGRDVGRPLTVLRVDGGLSRSQVLMQAVADLAQVPVEVYPTPHATCMGAVAMARMAVDPHLAMDQSVVPWTASAVHEPRWTEDRAAEHRRRWSRAVEATWDLAGPRTGDEEVR